MRKLTTANRLLAVLMATQLGCVSEPKQSDTMEPMATRPIDSHGNAGKVYFTVCNGESTDLQPVLDRIVTRNSAQNIPYTRNPANQWRDCSANFLRLSSYLASACPEKA